MINRQPQTFNNLTQEVIESQKKIINLLFETIDIYKNILEKNRFYKETYNHLTVE